jgi:hypothetical protein
MGTTDQHSQLKASYTTYHSMRRNWWPLFFDLADSASMNGYVVYKDAGRPLDHRKFLLAISKELREKGFRELYFAHFAGLSKSLQRMKWPADPPLKRLTEGIKHRRVVIKTGKCRVYLREDTRGIIR